MLIDKIEHAGVSAVLFVGNTVIRYNLQGRKNMKLAASRAVWDTIFIGVGKEVYDAYSGKDASIGDVLADLAGIYGCVLTYWATSVFRRPTNVSTESLEHLIRH